MPDQTEEDMSCKHHNSVQLTVSTNPSPPTRFQVLKTTRDSVSLKWDKPLISPVASLLRYSVEITRVDPHSKEDISAGSQSVESETETVTVGALASGGTYKFNVKVFTTEGDSSFSDSVTATTTFEKTELEEFKESLNLNTIESRLSAAERSGSWCAYNRGGPSLSKSTIITFDTPDDTPIMDSNMDPNALDRKTGVFTAPQAGVYLITFSLGIYVDTDDSSIKVVVLKDGNEMITTASGLSLGDGRTSISRGGQRTTTKSPTIIPVSTTGGRAVYQRLEAGNKISLKSVVLNDAKMGGIWFCVQFVSN